MCINGGVGNRDYFLEAEIKCPKCKVNITTASEYFCASNGLSFNKVIALMAKTIDRWNTRAGE